MNPFQNHECGLRRKSPYRQADLESFRKYGVNKGVLGACIFEALNLSARTVAGATRGVVGQNDKHFTISHFQTTFNDQN